MKRTLPIVGLIIVLFSMNLHAQNADTKAFKNQLLIAPFYLFNETFMISYERIFPDNGALRITPSVTLSNVSDGSYFSRKNREGVGVELAYKALLFPTAQKFNIYFGPYLLYRYVKNTYTDYPYYGIQPAVALPPTKTIDEFNVMGVGIDTGVKLTFGRFIMDFTFGGGLRYPLNNSNFEIDNSASDIFDDNFKGIAPRVNFMLGVAL